MASKAQPAPEKPIVTRSKESKAAGPAKTLASLGLEKFTMVEINRQQVKNADYNPRVISDAEKRKLKMGIQRHGMVAPIVWNKKTGNCVGGHQRLSQLDTLAGTKNYTLHVAQIDVDLTKEKEINILLNNPQAQGAWDLPKLSELVMDKSLNIESMGFDRSDLFRLLGEDYDTGQDVETLGELATKVREATKLYSEIQAGNQRKGGVEFYLVVIFKDEGDRTQFLDDAGLDDNRYQSGEDIKALCIRKADPPPDTPSPKSKHAPARRT
jgi:hypothetical protein